MTDKAYLDSRVFIELYSYKPAWAALEESQRVEIIDMVIKNVGALSDIGINVLAYGRNDPSTSQRQDCDFFCVYQVPDAATQQAFENEIANSGWYDFFEQTNVSGQSIPYADQLSSHVSDVSEEAAA